MLRPVSERGMTRALAFQPKNRWDRSNQDNSVAQNPDLTCARASRHGAMVVNPIIGRGWARNGYTREETSTCHQKKSMPWRGEIGEKKHPGWSYPHFGGGFKNTTEEHKCSSLTIDLKRHA